jgi:Fic family protein
MFFLGGVQETAEGAATTAQRLTTLFGADRERIVPIGRRAGSTLRVHDALKARPITSLPEVVRETGLTAPTAGAAMESLAGLGIARELTGRRRNRVFAYDRYLAILNEGTEPA